mgnify:CR=1 FL=1
MYLEYVIVSIYEIKKIEVNKDSKFDEIGLDSIEFVQLIVNIEDKFNIEFNEEELNVDMYKNVNDLVKVIEEHI